MTVATLLLDKNDNYVYADGSLPTRTTWDKELLKTFIQFGLISKEGYDLLPPSLQKVSTRALSKPSTPITIKEIATLSDILIITRSKDERKGKRFRLDEFEPVAKEQRLEIWRRK